MDWAVFPVCMQKEKRSVQCSLLGNAAQCTMMLCVARLACEMNFSLAIFAR